MESVYIKSTNILEYIGDYLYGDHKQPKRKKI